MLLRLVSLAGLSVRLAQCAQVPFQRQEPLASAGAAIHLTKAHPTVIISHGTILSGFPSFNVTAVEGPVQVEVKYTELFDGLKDINSDGPYLFSSQLGSNFRVETFAVDTVGVIESFFLQGSVLHQSITLIDGEGISLSSVGVRSTVSDNSLASLPGSFNCSKSLYSDVWALGPNSIRHACVRNGTQRSTWELAPEGLLIRGQRAARSAHISRNLPSSYKMSFETKILRGGTGWVLDTALGGAGIWMFLVGELPEGTYANHRHDLLPANSLVLCTGFGLVPSRNNGGHRFKAVSLPMASVIKEGEWLNITTVVTGRTRYSVFVDSQLVLADLDTRDYDDVPDFNAFFGNPTVGLGPWQDQAAFFRDLRLADADGKTFYVNKLDSEDVFAEFGVASNQYDVCLDGASRDRLIWTGDFYTAAWTIHVSTGELDFIRGTIDFSFDYRLKSGAIPTSNPMGIRKEDADAWSAAPSTLYTDYSLDLLNIYYEYYLATGDIEFIRSRWRDSRDLVTHILGFLDPSTHLLNTMIFKGSGEGTSSGCMLVFTLQNLAMLADVLEDDATAASYRRQAKDTASAVQTLLFDKAAGSFKFSIWNDAFAFIDFAWTVLSGVATPAQVKSQLKHLEKLKYKIAYLPDSNSVGSDSTVLAPYLSLYLLEALLQVGAEDEAEFLLDGIFGAMAMPSKDFSGSAWEYVSPAGGPGDGLFTSLNHPWGSGATSSLSRHILGISPLAPGYSSWSFAPVSLSLHWADGRVPTPKGPIIATWRLIEQTGLLEMSVKAPHGTSGKVVPPKEKRGSRFRVGEKLESGDGFWVDGGKTVWIVEEAI